MFTGARPLDFEKPIAIWPKLISALREDAEELSIASWQHLERLDVEILELDCAKSSEAVLGPGSEWRWGEWQQTWALFVAGSPEFGE